MSDARFIRRCLDLAARATGHTSPNPLVGAVIVKNGKILAEGYHLRSGFPHAEIEALTKLKFKAQGATLYCNLEPCFHYGRTPPCVHQIIESGMKRVIIAHRDPNPLVYGKSVKLLEKKGIEVKEGILKKEAYFLNRFFVTWVTQKRPYVILKAGLSLDGKISYTKSPLPWRERVRVRGGTKWITGPQARYHVHEIRSQVDAILVGVGTILADNPRLNVRGITGAKQPIRIVLDSHHKTPPSAQIFHSKGGEVLIETSGHEPLSRLLQQLAEKKITALLVEGGAEVFHSFLRQNLVDEIELFIAPKIIGSQGLAFPSTPDKIKKSFKINNLNNFRGDIEIQWVRI